MAIAAKLQQRDIKAIFMLCLIALFPTLTLIHVIVNGMNFPYWDDWELSFYIARSSLDGTLTLQDIFAQHVDHRNVFTNLLTVINAHLFNWNLHVTQGIVWLLTLVNAFLFVKIVNAKPLFVILLISILFFAPRQDWIFAFNNCMQFSILWSLLSVYAVQRWNGLRSILIACIFCIFATYSFGSGFLAWGLVGALLIHRGSRFLTIAIFAVFALFNIILFFGTYSRIGSTDFANLINVFPLIGSIFVLEEQGFILLSGGIGALGLSLYLIGIYTLYKRNKPILLYLLLGGWIIAIFCSIAMGGRFPLMPRHTSFGVIFWATTIIVTAQAFPYWRSRLPRYFAITVFALTLSLYVMLSGRMYYPPWWASSAECVKTYLELAPDECLTAVYPDPDRLREIIIDMKEAELGFVSEL